MNGVFRSKIDVGIGNTRSKIVKRIKALRLKEKLGKRRGDGKGYTIMIKEILKSSNSQPVNSIHYSLILLLKVFNSKQFG